MEVYVDWNRRLYSWMLRRLLLPVGDAVFQQSLIRRLRFLEDAQWWSREALCGARDAKLMELVHIAYHEVPFYRRLFDANKVGWDAIRRPADLRKLPIVTKAMIRPAYPKDITRPTPYRTHEESSSGSTGAPFYVLEDAETASFRRAAFILSLSWAGWSMGQPHLQTGVMLNRDSERKLKDFFMRCHYVSAIELDDDSLDETLDLLERKKVRHLWGYPCGIYSLAVRAKARGWNARIDSVVTWGDNLYPLYRREIESVFKARVYDTYGCSEGMQIAAQCGNGTSYHVHMLDTIVELVDDRGNPVEPGTPGNVVLTRLHPGAMPLIRYAVGDIAVGAGDRQCPCGRGFELLESIEGRDSDFVASPSGKRYVVHFFALVIEHYPQVQQYQVVQNSADSIVIRLVTDSGRADFAPAMVKDFRNHGLTDMKIEIVPVSHIPSSPSGKRRFVMNEATKLRPSVVGA